MLACFGLLISLPASDWLWRYLPGLKFIQFPWRFQPFVAIGCALLAATATESWRLAGRRPRMLMAAALTWLIIANAIFTVMIARLDEKQVTRVQVAELLAAAATPPITIEDGKRLQNEDDLKYLPYTANQIYFRPPGSDFNLYPPAKQPGAATLTEGKGRVEAQRLEIARREFAIENETPTQVRIETYSYPNWIARLDNARVEIKSEPGTGLMLVDVPAGRHRLTLDFVAHKTSERIAKGISIAAWLGLIGWLFIKLLRARR
jgi:hypothetical protein